MRRYVLIAAAALLVAGPAAAGPAPADDAQDVLYLGDNGPLMVRLHLRIDGKPYETAWQEFVTTVFNYLDTNRDGALSSEEAARAPTPQMLFGNGFFQGFRTPAVIMDFNRDGKVTKDELAKFYRDNGGAPFQFQAAGQAVNQQVVFAGGGMGNPAPSADALNEKIFKLLDTNKDGKLSKAELEAAPAILNKLDADDDEMVSVAELLPNTNSNIYGFATLPGMAAPVNNNSSFLLVNRRESGVALARRLLAHYGAKKGRPAARKLTRAMLGLDKETFAKLDADEDGELDAEELARFGRRPPELEFTVRLGKRGDKPLIGEVPHKGASPARAGKVRKTDKGQLMLDLGITRLVLRGEGGGRSTVRVFPVREQYKAQFKAADKDNNGYLDEKEIRQSQFFRNSAKMMDADGDGKLFEKEMLAYLDKMTSLQEAARKSCASLSVSDQGKGIFDLLDTNRDGRLGLREMRQLPALIEQLDRDGDGQISRTEIPRSYQLTFRRGPVGNNGVRYAPVVYPGMMGQQPLPNRTAGPRWFRKMDRNHDGDVSRREFLGTDEEFRRIDADGDGLISAEEADRYDKLRRKTP